MLTLGDFDFEEIVLATVVVLAGVTSDAAASFLVHTEALALFGEIGVVDKFAGSASSGRSAAHVVLKFGLVVKNKL